MFEHERRSGHLVRLAVLVCALLVTTAPAYAAGGNDRPTITFNPTAVSVGETYTVSGTGLPANTWVAVEAFYSHIPTWSAGVLTDSSGDANVTLTATDSGHIRHVLLVQGDRGFVKAAQEQLVVDP
jgi:hypothetical protein